MIVQLVRPFRHGLNSDSHQCVPGGRVGAEFFFFGASCCKPGDQDLPIVDCDLLNAHQENNGGAQVSPVRVDSRCSRSRGCFRNGNERRFSIHSH